VTRQLATTAADAENPLNSDQVRAISQEFQQPVTNGDGSATPLSNLLSESADRVLASIPANMNRTQIDAYIRAHNLPVPTDPAGFRTLRDELMAARASASALKGFISEVQEKGAVLETEFDLSQEQLNQVRAALPSGGVSSIETVLTVAQRHATSEGDQIAIFNERLEQGKRLGAVMVAQNERRAILENLPADNAILEGHRAGLQTMMARRYDDEMERLIDQAKLAQRNFSHANTTQVRKQEIVNESLFPIVRMCNQLRTMAIDMENFPVPDRLPRACNNFICSDNSMLGTFRYENEQAGTYARTGVDSRGRCTTVDCNGYYSQFICKERNKIDTIRNNLFSEFDRTGTICGQAFGSLRFD
jgi:hypothetical protein